MASYGGVALQASSIFGSNAISSSILEGTTDLLENSTKTISSGVKNLSDLLAGKKKSVVSVINERLQVVEKNIQKTGDFFKALGGIPGVKKLSKNISNLVSNYGQTTATKHFGVLGSVYDFYKSYRNTKGGNPVSQNRKFSRLGGMIEGYKNSNSKWGMAGKIYDSIRGGLKGTPISTPSVAPTTINDVAKAGKTNGAWGMIKGAASGIGKFAKGIPLLGAGLTALSLGDAISSGDKKEIGGSLGGIIGGTVGLLGGPLGSIAGAFVGDWIGEHIGGFFEESNENIDDHFKDLDKYNKKQEKKEEKSFGTIVTEVIEGITDKVSDFFEGIKLFFYDALSNLPIGGDYFKGKAAEIRARQNANSGGAPAGSSSGSSGNSNRQRNLTPDVLDPNNLGSLAAKYESQGNSALAKDFGERGAGVSFGKYQIATAGTRAKFLQHLEAKGGEAAEIAAQLRSAGFEHASGNNSAAIGVWKNLAAQGKIQQYEESFGRDFYYGTAFNGIQSQAAKDMISKSPTLQKALFSYALQGQHGAYKGINRDFKEGMTEKDLLELMYNDRLQRAERNKDNERTGAIKGLRRRLGTGADSERNLALQMLEREKSGQNGTGIGGTSNSNLVNAARNVLATSNKEHGYSLQPGNNRGQYGNYDCTGFVMESLKRGSFPPDLVKDLSKTNANGWPNVLKRWGFEEIQYNKRDTSNLQEGDILHKFGSEHGHVEMYAGNGNIIGAHNSKKGISEISALNGANFSTAWRPPKWMQEQQQKLLAEQKAKELQQNQETQVQQALKQETEKSLNQGGQPVQVAQNRQAEIDAKVNAKLKKEGINIKGELGADSDASAFNITKRAYRQQLYEAAEQGKDLNSDEFKPPIRRLRDDLTFVSAEKENEDFSEEFKKIVDFENQLKEKQTAALETQKAKGAFNKYGNQEAKPLEKPTDVAVNKEQAPIQNPVQQPQQQAQAPTPQPQVAQAPASTPQTASVPSDTGVISSNATNDPFNVNDWATQAFRIDPLTPVCA